MENVEPNAFVAALQEALCERGRVEDDLVKQADATSITAVMECEEVHDHLVTVLPAAFEAADPAHKASLVEAVALALVRKLDDGTLAEAPAKKCLETIGLELGTLSTSHLATLLEAILERLQSTLRAANGGPHALELLPKCLNLLATVERCHVALGDGSSAADGAAIVAYALKAILVTAWPAGCMLGLAMSLRELEVPKGQLQPLVGKMLRRLADVEVSQLPALTYQLLLLGDADGKTKVLRALNAHFDEMLAACEAAAAKDELVPTRLDPDQLGHVQGAVVLHIQLAVKQDQALGLGLLRLLKSGQLRLGPFALSLLLSLARIKRFEEPTVSAIVSLVRADLQLASHCALSPWVASFAALATACPPAKPDALLLGAVRASAAGGWDHLVPSLVALAAALLDSPPPAASAAALLPSSDDSAPADGGVPTHRLPAATRLPLLGQQMMVEVFALHAMVRAEVMEALCSRILSRGDAVHHWVALLQELVVQQPTLLLDHAPKLKQLLEYVLHLPPAVASPMLRSLLPLQRQRPELKDTLVLLLRKAMFHREEELRLTAVHGFLLLLHGTADADRPADGALQFQLELLGFIRRSFSQQASIRSVLYGGLVAAFEQQPPLRDLVAELLASQLRTYLASDPSDALPDEFDGAEAEAPLDLRACLHATTSAAGDDVVVMLEPLPDLIRAVTRCAHASDGTAAPSGAMRTLGGMVGQMVAGFCRCSLRSLGLSDKVELSQASSHSAMTLATAGMLERVLEALIEWTVLCPAHVSGGGSTQEGEEAAAVASPGPSQLTASSKLLPESARVLYKLLVDVQARLKDGKPATKAKGRKAVPIPKFGAYGLSLAACEAVLASIASDQAVQSSGRASHFVRHVLRACEAQARRIAADAAAAIRAGQLQLSEAHLRDLRSVASIGKLLLALVPRAEAQTGKEAPSGRLGRNPLTGEKEVATPKASGSKAAGGKSGGGKAAAAKSGDRTAMASRLQLVLDAAGACISALTGSPSLLPLGMMLMPTATPAAASPAAGGSQAPTSVDVLALAEGHLLRELLPLAERLAYDDSHREAEAATAIAAQLCAVLPASRLKQPLAWSAAVLRREAHLSTAVRKAFLATHLRLERASGTHRAGSLSVAKELHHLLGDNLRDEEPGERPEKLEMLEEGSANNVSATLLEAVEVELGELSQAYAHLSRVGEAARRPEADDKDKEAERAADALERALCDRYTQVVSVLRLLLKSQIEGSPAQGLLKLCTALFKQLDAVFKGVMAVDKGKKGASKRLEALLSHVCGETGVTLAMYGLLSFSTSSEDTAARVVREAKLVPALVFALEKFEATVVKLSKTSERDLLRFMKRTTARDFKIQAEEVANAIRRKEDKAEKEKEKEKGKGKKRKAAATPKGKGKKGKKAADEEEMDEEEAEEEEEEEEEGEEEE